MEILLRNVLPDFIEKEKIARSEVWGKEIVFTTGQFVQIIAPSGSGKTSLVHFLYNLRQDYSGSIEVDKKVLQKLDAEANASLRATSLSIIFQDLRLFPDHTALQNIEIKQALVPFKTKYSIREMASKLGIESKLGQQAKKCSQGERQRIAIIRALQQPFQFLLADEPFSHLDDANAALAMHLIEEESVHRNASIILADLHKVPNFNMHKTIML